jgi:hypothetical protein
MLDASNAPFLIIGDAPHSILANLSNSDAATYLTNRGQRGFNALWIELLCNSYTFGYGTEGTPNYGRDVNGNNPFTSTLGGGFYDLTTPNEVYWSHVDYIVQQAAANGLQCVFTPLDQGGWTQTSLVNGTTRCQQYGQFLGNRYKNYPNIIWNFGNDFQQWRTPLNDAVILAIADGLRSADSNHLITIQLDYFVSESQDDTNWIPRINTNGVYTYYPTYAETLVAYNKPAIMPVLFLEENYEDENNVGELGTPKVLRRQEYWSMGGGALAGHMYGSYWTDRFANGWQSHLNTQAVTELGYFKNFFNSIHWYDLVPDQSHTFLIAGYGTFSGIGHVGDNDYATGLRTQDGTLGVVYTPVSHTLTIAMSSFAGPVTARWYDPSADTFTNISGSPFPNSGSHNFTTPGNNSAGDPDWVLLLQAALGSPTPTPTPTPTASTDDCCQCGAAVFRLQNVEAASAERVHNQAANIVLVFRHQNGFTPADVGGGRHAFERRRLRSFPAGEVNVERRAAAGSRPHIDMPLALLHNAVEKQVSRTFVTVTQIVERQRCRPQSLKVIIETGQREPTFLPKARAMQNKKAVRILQAQRPLRSLLKPHNARSGCGDSTNRLCRSSCSSARRRNTARNRSSSVGK